MGKKNLAVLYEYYFSERDFKRFGINILKKYFNIYLFEFTPSKTDSFELKNKIKLNKARLNNFKAFKVFLKKNQVDFYIDIMDESFLSFRIRLLLEKENVLRIKMKLGLLPWSSAKISSYRKIINFIKRGNILSAFSKDFFNRAFSKLEPKIDISLNSGSFSKAKNVGLEIWTHSFDYQTFLESESDYEFNYLGKYALFIDQFAPSHPDYKFNNNKPPVTEENYYNSMNRFFDFFTKKTGLKIVVAGHPRRNKENDNVWNGRPQIMGKTNLLIKQCSIVLTHYSTAISFAVIYRKPILLVATDEYFKSYRNPQILSFSEALKKNIINIDNFNDIEINKDIFNINESIFMDYEEKYIRSKNSKANDIWHHFSKKLLENQPLKI